MVNRPTFRAQSAMEYLMTYGWAILIIAVVLAALFSLGVFNGTSLLGQSCVASPGYLCSGSTMTIAGGQAVLGFTFGQNTGQTIYDVELACAATSNTAGYPNNAAAFNVIGASGSTIGTQTAGTLANSITLNSGQTIVVSGLPCYGTTGLAMSNPSLGTSFSGFMWLNYTTSSCTSSCNWYTVKVATVTQKVA